MRLSKQTEAKRVASNMAAETMTALFVNYTSTPPHSVTTPYVAKPRLATFVEPPGNPFIRTAYLDGRSIEQCHKTTGASIEEIVAWYTSVLNSNFLMWQRNANLTRRNTALSTILHAEALEHAMNHTYASSEIVEKYTEHFTNSIADYEF